MPDLICSMEELIKKALPGVDESIIIKVNDRLKELGMLFEEDARYVEESYLTDILKPIQLKKLLFYFSQNREKEKNVQEKDLDSAQIHQIIPIESLPSDFFDISPSISEERTAPSVKEKWAEVFNIPWSLFPNEVLEACESKKRLRKSLYSEMIRALASQIFNINQSPGRKNLRIIAMKIVSRYPSTFEDRYGDTVIAGGCTTLMKKIEYCIENKKRRKSMSDIFQVDPVDSNLRKTTKNSYACIDWQPNNLPSGETKDLQLQHKSWLKTESKKLVRDESKIYQLMELTYPSQRYTINSKKTVKEISEEWPILFENNYFTQHVNILLGKKNCVDTIINNINLKGKHIYNFMKSKVKDENVMNCLQAIENSKTELCNLTPETIGAIPLIIAYFHEEERSLIQTVTNPFGTEETMELTPFISTSGGSIYSSENFTVIIDGHLVMHAKTFKLAFAVMFLSYYVFNIEYSNRAPLTLEFIQRIFADINPGRGGKTPKTKGRKQHDVATKVLTLANQLRDFESHFTIT